jgi:hypothetical protein
MSQVSFGSSNWQASHKSCKFVCLQKEIFVIPCSNLDFFWNLFQMIFQCASNGIILYIDGTLFHVDKKIHFLDLSCSSGHAPTVGEAKK